jgi:hypothetical protein
MSLLDKASLIVTPNSYKESKLYSVVPNTTLGDMDVVRATTATRVNSSGLIEVVPRNLLTYSEQFDNAAWTKSNLTVTANAAIAPNGTMTAEKIIGTAINATHIALQQVSFPTNTIATCSIYAKAAELSFLYVGGLGRTPSANEGYVFFNLSNGTVGVNDAGYTGSISNEGNGWYKLTVNAPIMATSTLREFRIGVTNTNGVQSYLGDGTSGVFVWGAQLETGSQTEYFPTTTRLNIPRIDYTNGSCPSLLVEPQRTNLVPNPFAYSGSQVAFNSTVVNSPISGGLSTRITKNEAAGTLRYASQICSATALSALTAYTISAFFKYDGYDVQTSIEHNNFNQWGGVSWSQLINIASTGITLGASSACTSTVENYGNGWHRVNVRITTGVTILGTPPVSYLIRVASSLSTGQGFLHTAAQLEAGSYATSYIPTTSASVTRNADVISKTGISSLIDSQQGVLFADLQFLTGLGGIRSINISNGSNNNRIGFYGHPSVADRITFAISSGGVTTDINYNGVILTNRNKVLIRYSGTTFTSFVNGVKSSNQTFTPFAANFLNRIGLDYGEDILRYEGRINSIQLYKTALTDAECIALTTL